MTWSPSHTHIYMNVNIISQHDTINSFFQITLLLYYYNVIYSCSDAFYPTTWANTLAFSFLCIGTLITFKFFLKQFRVPLSAHPPCFPYNPWRGPFSSLCCSSQSWPPYIRGCRVTRSYWRAAAAQRWRALESPCLQPPPVGCQNIQMTRKNAEF